MTKVLTPVEVYRPLGNDHCYGTCEDVLQCEEIDFCVKKVLSFPWENMFLSVNVFIFYISESKYFKS